tara:strand:- start:201 stop:431 length:231 start_codon:yes stop_codon:yes gene_type:complete
MFRSKRRKELENKEEELWLLKLKIEETGHWCAYDSPDVGFAMEFLMDRPRQSVSSFRDKLRKGEFTFDNYKERRTK